MDGGDFTSIGAYAFTFDDWKEREYPLDLWLKWNCAMFDEVSLFYIGDRAKVLEGLNIQDYENLNINGINNTKKSVISRWGEGLYAHYKELAQHFLATDWKFMLDIDEFLGAVPETDTLDYNKVYGVWEHVLFGDVNHEISVSGFSPIKIGDVHWSRLAYGTMKVVGDGALLEKPVNGGVYHVYHTTLLKNGAEISRKTWLWQKSIVVEHDKYKDYWPDMKLDYVNDEQLPAILRKNKARFQFFKGGQR